MELVELEFQKLLVAESVVLACHGFDFVVGAFQRSVRDRVCVPGQDAVLVTQQRAGEALQHPNAGAHRLVVPVEQLQSRGGLTGLFPELFQVVLQVVRDRQ